jgi:hypothetical protein
MKTFYSILSAVINPSTNENLSLGLLLSDGNNSFFSYSRNRFSILKEMIQPEKKKFIDSYLKSIKKIIDKVDINEIQSTILIEEGKNIIVNEKYIDYLSVYNNNVITFSKPVSIDVEVRPEIFDKLFARFISEETLPMPKASSDINFLKSDFCLKVNKYFSIDKTFTHSDSPKLLLPVTIDLFGQNKIPVMAQFLDLSKKTNFIKSDLYDFQLVSEMFRNGKKFVISSEPDKVKFAEQHYAWSVLRKIKKFEYIEHDEIGKIEEYASMHNVVPV